MWWVAVGGDDLDTLHRLVGRGRPWRATPSELSAELMLSPAGITGRLDALEGAGLVRRLRSAEDRRRVDVELTELGHSRWAAAIQVWGAEEGDMVAPLDAAEQDMMIGFLRRMLLHVEGSGSEKAR
ncbi:MarR family winged helix-turn-helix transcriptional regulator [Streptomyces huiliensis]|uniref:MarR family winged helix-turn-helix transcriptional regulator n=1 Tax=Streptomyces huiliensis TaxID=2876027 RepID=UPI001CBABB89|nr:MarR family transcriptional regulator [Streptomyces huiliensis]MBZ4320893.1 MarR family transcriptional regulator [Streptomyces huiliensis]